MTVDRRKCGCTYLSHRAATVIRGIELAGYRVSICDKHRRPKK